MRARQLTLSLDLGERFTAEDFLVVPTNADAYSMLTSWPNWPAKGLLLVGPPGSGKSHLAAIWAQSAMAMVHQGEMFTEDHVAQMAPDSALVIEDIDHDGMEERVLFHAMNASRERNVWLLLTASQPPNAIWPQLPDLASRLRQLPSVDVLPPGDELVRAVLVKLFDDRQLVVDAEVVDYIARRIDRSLRSAREVVAALDEEALSLGRKVTRPIASQILSRLISEVD